MHKQDMLVTMLESQLSTKSAFNKVDHVRIFAIMKQLGFPDDALRVVADLHRQATTRIHCKFGQADAIPVRRGTIQGNSLSPLLFIIFMEPLLWWLAVKDRIYRCASVQGS